LKLQITINGKTYEAEVEVLEDDESPLPPSYPPYQPPPGALTQVYTPGTAAGEEKICRSPVTGLVIKVNIEPGQEVMANDLIMVLEAMKMEANVTAPCTGKVKSVSVAPGDSVKVNQIIVEIE
jgi:methylmalonyl-CoA carboxyltransferase small subunit